MLDSVGLRKSEIGVDLAANVIGIEVDRVQSGRKCACQRRLASARQAHDQDLAMHYSLTLIRLPGFHARVATATARAAPHGGAICRAKMNRSGVAPAPRLPWPMAQRSHENA